MVVYPALKSGAESARDPERRLEEAVGLTLAIDLLVVHSEWFALNRPVPATLLGGGAVERLGAIIKEQEVELAFVDSQLTPVQQRNLEKAWDCKVIDRTGLILEIFGERARTKEGQLQVELAALTYQRSRLVRSWTHLERQRGGLGFIGGPGESQLEIDRRLITERITKLKRQLEQVTRTRKLHRKARKRVPYPVVALVGYTNAGKSTLFNRLTASHVFAKDLLFATLDPTLRQLKLPSGRMVILSDTVGFISDLPTDLVAAFRATLEEVIEADLILHVRDVAEPDTELQKREVISVMKDLGLEEKLEEGVLEVLNKIDLLPEAAAEVLLNQAERDEKRVACSALTGQGSDALLSVIDAFLSKERELVELDVQLSDGEALAWLYRRGEVVRREDEALTAHLAVRLAPDDLARFEQRFGARH
ncbi:GTPase HflX [Limibacillus halophilus]